MEENGTDCYQPVCEHDDPLISMRRLLNQKRRFKDFDDDEDDKDKEVEVEIEVEVKAEECPIGRNTLGLFTWNFLHTMAIYYPDKPTPEQKQKMIQFVDGLAEFYPCRVCKGHFQKDILKNPPKVESREDISVWFCLRHNDVNRMLGKPQFDCKFSELDLRWRIGYPSCGKVAQQF